MYNAHKRTGKSMNTNYQMFGYDIMLDNQLNPWILEVNLSPSLATDSPIDRDIKSNLVNDIFNLIGVRKTVPKTSGRRHTTRSLKITSPVRPPFYRMGEAGQSPTVQENDGLKRRIDKKQGEKVRLYENVEISVLDKISKVSAKHRSILYDFLQESERNVRLNFTRIYPAPNSDYYDRLFETERPNNKLIYKYLYKNNDLGSLADFSKFVDPTPTLEQVHLLTAKVGGTQDSAKSSGNSPSSPKTHKFRPIVNLTISS
jgi:hypothetical protein